MLAIVKSLYSDNCYFYPGVFKDENDFYLKVKSSSVFVLLGFFDPVENKYYPNIVLKIPSNS